MRDGNSSGPAGPGDPASAGSAVEPASVHVIVERGRTGVVLSGEVAADLAEATADAEAAGQPIDVDAQHVTFIDSSGVAFLARLATRVQGPVRVLNAPESVRFLLQVTRMHELLEVVDDEPEDEPEDELEATPDPSGLPTIGPLGRVRPEPPDVIA
ncbi:MAG TPA: STAS domain-containing protein [Actinotalea sp.]|nr:STAS domain-containing protein [Actinotalea sp.]